MKGSATLSQKQKEALMKATFPDPSLFRDRDRDYRNVARDIANNAVGIEKSIYQLFGPDFIGSLAFALDPMSSFAFEGGLISYWNRSRVLSWTPGRSSRSYQDIYLTDTYKNYYDDLTPAKTFHFVGHESEVPDRVATLPYPGEDSVILDTTVKSRGPDSPFGMLQMSIWSADGTGPSELILRERDDFSSDEHPELITREVRQTIRAYEGPIARPNGSTNSPSYNMESYAWDTLNKEVLGMLPSCLASKRLFNTFYNIAELKDIPQMIAGLKELASISRRLLREKDLSKTRFSDLVGNQYLNAQFGVLSVEQAALQLLKLPAKAAKRMNYLIRRNGKITTGRATRKYKVDSPLGDVPSFEYDLPTWAEFLGSSTSSTMNIELRMAISQTLRFPEAAVPELSDSNYRRLLGLTPTISDIYNLIPWSWMIDWFGGLGDYIDVMDAINADTSLINYGFMTFVSDETLNHKCRIGVTDRFTTSVGGNVLSEELNDKLYYSESSYKRRFHMRVDMSYLDGVKTYGKNWQGNLSAYQGSILGALLSKYT